MVRLENEPGSLASSAKIFATTTAYLHPKLAVRVQNGNNPVEIHLSDRFGFGIWVVSQAGRASFRKLIPGSSAPSPLSPFRKANN